jgi:hypothetical protein
MPEVADHPNRMPFQGVLTKIDEPSDNPPEGSNSKRVMLTRAAAESALDSLAGMAVDYTPGFDGHDPQAKIGIITDATIEGHDLCIKGFIYASDFPEEAAQIKDNKDALGFSFEAENIHVESTRSDPLVITSCVFTGAAILQKKKAAYTTTSLAASADNGEFTMDEATLKTLLAEAVAPLAERMDKIEGSVNASIECAAKVKPHTDAIRSCASAMEAAGMGTGTTHGHVHVLRRMADHMDAEAAVGKLPHIFRDHDYTTWMAGAAKTDPDPKPNAEIEELKSQLAALGTKLEDKVMAQRQAAPAPERKTLTPQITHLLAKAHIDLTDDKMSIAALDSALKDSGLTTHERFKLKAAMHQSGLIDG